MTSQQRLARVFLTTVDSPPDAVLRQLVADHGLIDTAEMVAAAGYHATDWELDAIRTLDRARRRDMRFLIPDDAEWPPALSLDDGTAPFGLWVRGGGDLRELLGRAVVVLGSVKATPYAVKIAHDLGRELSAAGWRVVTSSMFGVSSAVLRASDRQRPAVVFPFGGITRPRPLGDTLLLRRTSYAGALVSELPDRPADRSADLARQTRLLAAAGAAVVVVEPRPLSLDGAVIRRAASLGRPVFTVPGVASGVPAREPVRDDERAANLYDYAHGLIRDGLARLARGADDILDDLDRTAGGSR